MYEDPILLLFYEFRYFQLPLPILKRELIVMTLCIRILKGIYNEKKTKKNNKQNKL